jgi:hypothetical protein
VTILRVRARRLAPPSPIVTRLRIWINEQSWADLPPRAHRDGLGHGTPVVWTALGPGLARSDLGERTGHSASVLRVTGGYA